MNKRSPNPLAAPKQNAPVLTCNNLSKTFHDGSLFVEVLKPINFSVHARERIAIVGPSGAGKSTLLHLLGGLDRPSSGEIFLAGKNLDQLSENHRSHLRNRYLGFIYQFHHLLPEFTVLENACIPLLLAGIKPFLAQKKALNLLKKVGLVHRQHHKLGELSGGERQRTAIVRALVNNPLCILADEPTGNLDSHTAEQVYQTLLELNEEFNTSLVIVTHDHGLASRLDRTLHMEDGQLISI
ncbi:MAG: lipoprotein-releasing ABC transporter ATP-binding protein LolD [Gammaproteobacteria bacterium]|nr:MAG: lipoprotein-releasing ABC transporter ATP-binding protein LolD [Gammaproteobacteria bacterium]